MDRLIRGCDPQPGALARLGDEPVRLFGSRQAAADHHAEPGSVLGIHADDGRLEIAASGNRLLRVEKVRVGAGKKVAAADGGLRSGDRLR